MPLPKGVYVPMPAFFTPAVPSPTTSQQPTPSLAADPDSIDIPATQRHTARLLAAGVTGLVVHGSNGEAVHLSRRERRAVIEAVADTVRHETDSHSPVPIIAGCSAQSVRETLELCREARDAGATHALVLPPAYYRGLVGVEGILGYYRAVADRGALPVVVYNFPPAANGVDLDSDVLLRLAEHPRIVGVKLTCGNTGKLARLVEGAPRVRGGRDDFFVGGGSADFILQGLAVGAHGTISGLANLAPRACVRIGELFEQGRLAEARALQHEVAKADWLAIRYGFVGVKAAMPIFHGPGEDSCAVPRLPFTRLEEDSQAVKEIRQGMAGALAIEARLSAEAASNK
ncbi:78e4a651-753f-45e8-ad04-eba5cc2da1cd [Thermothielavioides terrestris]|uniref:78e4a651-753f-45e8-ad04-eba5cc2da1cd n=1 Tax=Thermothielavioides terrestris TaxID=2587410 RepID=A0A3S4BFA8_9PEZI|nr:78e4a651-753f-45e8-ad04-eba5cc2da1cd [Thermothielavioides terrestris]